MFFFSTLESTKYIHTNFRDDTSDRKNSPGCAGAEGIEQNSAVTRHHRKVSRTEIDGLLETGDVV